MLNSNRKVFRFRAVESPLYIRCMASLFLEFPYVFAPLLCSPRVGVPLVIMPRQKTLGITDVHDLLTPRHVVRDESPSLAKGGTAYRVLQNLKNFVGDGCGGVVEQ